MRICALVCLAALAACTTSSLLLAQNHRPSESELRSEIEEHAIDPCLRAVLGNIGLRGKMSVAQYKRYLKSIGNKGNDLMIAAALPIVSDFDKRGDRMEVYYRARFDCIKGAMKSLTTGEPPSEPKPKVQSKPQAKSSWGDRFLELADSTRKVIKRSDDTILEVSLGGNGKPWFLIIEVARNTATQYARTVGDNALYIMERKLAEFGPADYDIKVQRAGTPWVSTTDVSTIWKGIKRKGERRVKWEQVIGEDRAIRKKKPALKKGETFDSVFDEVVGKK